MKIFANLIAFAAAWIDSVLFNIGVRTGLILTAIPTAADFQTYRVTNQSQSEVIRQRLYDFQLYATAGTQQLSFFSLPIGQGVTSAPGATVGSAKTRFDTNMVLGNQLPSGQEYLIESIEVLFSPGSVNTANTYTMATISNFNATAAATVAGAMNDVNTVYQSGHLSLQVLSKEYLGETGLWSFPPKSGYFEGVAAVASNSATTAEVAINTARAAGRPYYLEPQISLQPATNFGVNITWPAAVATPSGFNGRIGVLLDGFLMRASQ